MYFICLDLIRDFWGTKAYEMGVDPTTKRYKSKTKRSAVKVMPLYIAVISIVMVMGADKWRDFVMEKEDGTVELTPERQRAIDDKISQRREGAELYYLVSLIEDYYECLHCPEGVFYLKVGEIAKIGTTINSKDRYSLMTLKRWNLQYETIMQGSLQEVLEAELQHIANYPLAPENLMRPIQSLPEFPARYRLARPIRNTFDG